MPVPFLFLIVLFLLLKLYRIRKKARYEIHIKR
nr:MAG TPA: receptor tyrosine kinase [Caudoviricetes sp.]